MSDDTVDVRLVGGPMGGATLPVPREAVYDDPEPGMDFVPSVGSAAPDGHPRVLYTAEPAGPPDVWHWQGWVP